MNVLKFENSSEFFDEFSPLWLESEAEADVLYRIAKANKSGMVYYAVSDSDGKTQLTASLAPRDQIVLTGKGTEAAKHLAHLLADQGLKVPGIFAANPLSLAFAEAYSEKVGIPFQTVKQLGHYSLARLTSTPKQFGKIREATFDDQEILVKFRTASQLEENLQRPSDPVKSVHREITEGKLFVLKNPELGIVCAGSLLLDRSPFSGHINGVFTPRDYRKRGYASCLVHSLSKMILDRGLIPRLSVDVINIPAITVYEKLGYVRDCQMDNMRMVLE